MKIKFLIIPLLFAVLSFLILPAFAQFPSPYKQSTSITCGNNVCEETSHVLLIGESKTISIGGKGYAFKLIKIDKIANAYPVQTSEGLKEETYYKYAPYFSIDGSSPMTAEDAKTKMGLEFDAWAQYKEYGKDAEGANLRFEESKICAVPDCAFKIEVNVYKKWNIVPMYFFGSAYSSSGIEEPKLGTCKLEDFLAIYGYNPVNNTYVRLYSFGRTYSDTSELTNLMNSEKIVAGTPFNSVWAYSNKECTLAAEMPNSFKNFLLLFSILAEQEKTEPKIGFAPGWNFWSGSPDMEGKSFNEIKGTCTIEKAYSFDAGSQSWKKLQIGVGPEKSFVFKVKDRCLLGLPETAPPEVPAEGPTLPTGQLVASYLPYRK